MRTRDWLLLVFLSLLWGASFFFAAVAVRDIPPLTLVLARVAIAALILLAIARALGHSLPRGLAAWRSYAVLAILNNLIPFSLIFYGQTRIASALASVLNATTPLFALIVARLFAGEALTAAKLGGVLLGILGVAILMGPAVLSANAGSTHRHAVRARRGLLLWPLRALDAAAAGHPADGVGLSQLLCSTLLLLPVAAAVDRFWELRHARRCRGFAPCWGWRCSRPRSPISSSSASTAAAGPSNVMLVTLLIPVSATALGALVLGERLAPNQIAGALVIASALLVIDGRIFGGWMRGSRARPDARDRGQLLPAGTGAAVLAAGRAPSRRRSLSSSFAIALPASSLPSTFQCQSKGNSKRRASRR